MPTAKTPLLTVENLQTHFFTELGTVKAVEDVSFSLAAGETLAVVGESGSGKSVTGLSIMGLIPPNDGRIVGGSVRFTSRSGGMQELTKLSQRELRRLRGDEIAMIFQDPMTSLNPVFSIGDQIAESVELHLGKTRKEALAHALRMLELVEIPLAARRLNEYPHQLSGGMRQRVMIALGLACNPTLLIADEPTTALDVTIQAQILSLLQKLQQETGTGILFITHNLGVVAEIADRVVVMYAGRVVEQGTVTQIFESPRHPYTEGLLACLPGAARRDAAGKRTRLTAIPGQVASPLTPPPGCAFEPRCPRAQPVCRTGMPPLFDVGKGQTARCVLYATPGERT